MRFDLTDLRLFLAIAEAGSITHGAATVGLSLPAASQRLRDMEALGEVALLDRGRRGVTLTEAGEALSHHARIILLQMARMRGELGVYATGLRSSIRIHANTAAIIGQLPTRLGPWMSANPQVDLDLRERQSGEIARAVRGGFADLGVLSSPVDSEGLRLHPFMTDRLVVVVAPGSALADQPDVAFEELSGLQFVGMAGSALQDHLEAQARRHAIKLNIRIALRDFNDICRMAAQGVGVAIVPESAARRAKRSVHIKVLALRDGWSKRKLSLCVATNRSSSPVVDSLLRHFGVDPRATL